MTVVQQITGPAPTLPQNAPPLIHADYYGMHELSLHGWHIWPIIWVLAIFIAIVATVLVVQKMK